MKIYNLPVLSQNDDNKEFYLGCDDLDTNAVYILYGRLSPNESNREVKPLEAYDGIFYLLKGEVQVTREGTDFTISDGEAFHIKKSETVNLRNLSDRESVYIMAGGSTPTPE